MLDNLVAITPETSNMWDYAGGQLEVQTAYQMPDSSYYPIVRSGFKSWAAGIQTMGTHGENPIDGRDPQEVSRLTEMETYSRLAAEELGATWYWETPAYVLVQDEEGNVTGVIGNGPNGFVKFNASKGVVLATGDFAHNADMVWNLLDDVNELGARNGMVREDMTGAGRDGSGIKLGCWAGGNIESHPRPSMNTQMYTPGPWGSSPFLALNNNGERFMDEGMSVFHSVMMLRQPHGLISLITDANYMDTLKHSSIDHGSPCWGEAYVARGIWDKMQEDMTHVVEAGAEGGDVHDVIGRIKDSTVKVYGAETLDELLGILGYEGAAKEQALASIERYNELCYKGSDDDFGKDDIYMKPIDTPPFFGVVRTNTGTKGAGLCTLAGLVTNDNLAVLRSDYTTPIQGLYAAGNCVGHRFGPGYSTASAGASVGMALTHGRVLGKYLASL